MFRTRALVNNIQIAAGVTNYYTAPAGTRTRITQCSVTNNDIANRSFNLHLVPSAGTPSAANRIIKDKMVMTDEAFVPYQVVGAVLEPGMSIQASASSGNALTLYVSGIEITQ